MSLLSFLETILTLVAGESMLRPYPHSLRRRESHWWSWSFFRLVEKVCWVEDDCFLLDVSARAELVNLFFPESLSSFFADLFLWRHLEFILRVLKNSWSIAFASIFSTASSKSPSPGLGHPSGPERKVLGLSEIWLDHYLLVWSYNEIKLLKDRL